MATQTLIEPTLIEQGMAMSNLGRAIPRDLPPPTAEQVEIWKADFVAWMESDHAFVVDRRWEDGRWVKAPSLMELTPLQKAVLRVALAFKAGGFEFIFRTLLLSFPKKSGKTALAAAVTLWYAWSRGDNNEIYIIANDLQQAKERVFGDVVYAVNHMPWLKAKVRLDRVVLTGNNTEIITLGMHNTSAAGSRHGLTVWDELWGFCVSAGTKVLRDDLVWVNAEDLIEGDGLVAFEEEKSGQYRSWKRGRVVKTGVRSLPAVHIQTSQGEIVATPDHKWLAKKGKRNHIEWIKSGNLRPGDLLLKALDVWGQDKTHGAGYLAAAYDGEGSLSLNPYCGGYRLDFSQNENEMLEKMKFELDARNYNFYDTGRDRPCKQLTIGHKRDVLRFLGEIRPLRLLPKFDPEKLGRMTAIEWVEVVSVERIQDQEMVTLTTDTKTYLADGYCAHNTSELHHRMWDEMTPVPTEPASLRLIVTYAGYEPGSTGRSDEKNLLWDLYTKNVGSEEYKEGKGTLVRELFSYPVWEHKRVFTCWFHEPTMPWQDEEYYEDEKDELRTGAYIRLHDNRFASSSEQFVDMDWWDKSLVLKGPLLPTRTRAISIGVDFAPKHNCAAVVGTYFDWETKKVRQAFHKIWSPKPKEPLDPAIVENYLLSVFVKYRIYYMGYDPYQFHGSGVRLAAMGLPMREVTQTDAHMIPATEELYGLLKYDRFETYNDAQCREHVSAAVAEDRGKGARLSKVKTGAKNDYTIALAISALESVNSGGIPLEDEVIIESPFADTSEWPVDYDRWKQEQALPFELRSTDDEIYYGE